MTYKVITEGRAEYGHNFEKGDIVELTQRDAPIPGLDMYTRTDGVYQALDKNDVEEIV